MVASLNKFIFAFGLLFGATSVLAAESLPDPTKPAVDIPYESETGKVGVGNELPVPKKEGLQSIIISHQRRAAVINGVTVAQGEKIGDATLVEVRGNSVVLQSSQGKRVMELFPGVHINNSESAKQEKVKSRPNGNKKEIKQETINKVQKSPETVNPERN
jgi:hypothetical protein